ncbi:DUF3618 domain-containing protein [Phycicoccus sp. CSK15P-2]|uniref:DUF3618 domain-containing protein n=1 Tax=Phycicoccus sp. CSK15P-2 TaxID=2807627 RepID=UPI00194F3195|nr:DUF3618 domain-containing protein [Phycicoccus sp. CSK15P-2]MBM6404297.1 DUF3618 domain-containing protein [Phycicoccus sp. CSK15P-2]
MSQKQSISSLEAEVVARRRRLAATVDELTEKATPSAILKREVDKAKARFADVAETPEGELRVDRLAMVVAVVAVVGGAIAYRAYRRR